MLDPTKNKYDCYKGEDCVESLREHAIKIMNYKKKEMVPLIDEENELYQMQKVCYICKKIYITDKNDNNVFKQHHKVRDHCHYRGKFAVAFAI